MELRLKEITIKAYESQINPHFLFNTLQMIQMMNVLGRKEDVSTAISSLAQLLRFNLDSNQEIRISEEIKNVIYYLKILKIRFKDRFSYNIMIPDELMDCYTVKFMLQPLIENAVKHGFGRKKGDCEIAIMGQLIHDEIVIVVKDNGSGISEDKLSEIKKRLSQTPDSEEGGIGLFNVNKRIQCIYGEEYGLDIFSKQPGNTQVLIHIPYTKKKASEGDEGV